MKNILMITGKDYDDSEVLYPYYRLIEEGFDVDIASVEKGEVTGKYHFKINANLTFDEVNPAKYDGLLLPGGKAPEKLRIIDKVCEIVREFEKTNKPIAAICHGQQLLISADVLYGKNVTCYPGIRDDIKNAGAIYIDKQVVVDKNFITSRRPEDLPYFMGAFLKLL
ncbi:MAG: type 1 glutamine amidotransferase [Clostridiales bacterium]|jgi:protease I|nr:type 1 glutamine amidotransferase [Clostridiales bacterium]